MTRLMSSLLLKNARFIISSPSLNGLPKGNVPEFAFLGRSNVGKSSLINLVCGQKGLAHTSSTPGRTRLLNYFEATLQQTVDAQRDERPLAIVDLPGIGFAKVSKEERGNLSELLTSYISGREQIRAVFHLVDIRREANDEDREISEDLRALGPAYFLVATKSDKFGKSARNLAISKLAAAFSIHIDQVVASSTIDKFGQKEIWEHMWNHASPN